MKKMIISVLFSALVVTSCTKENQVMYTIGKIHGESPSQYATPKPTPTPTPEPERPNYIEQPQYIDESLYNGEELEIVKVLNKLMKATLEGDVNSYKNVLTKEHYHQKDTDDYLSRFKITYLAEPSFYSGPSEYTSDIEVTVDAQIFKPQADILINSRVFYFMFKENNEWKIGGSSD